jgi:hypothetical protein
LIGPFVLEKRLNDGNYLNFLTKEWPLFMEEVSLETSFGTFFQRNEATLNKLWLSSYGLLVSA